MSHTSNTNDIPVLTALTEDQVTDYLRRNPDFLSDKPALLADMNLPHQPGGGAISLVERQVSVLRERNMDMRHRLNKLLENARTNDTLFEKTKRLVLAMLDMRQLDDCLDALFFSFQSEFDIHYSQLLLIASEENNFPSPANKQARLINHEIAEDYLSNIIHNRRAICGQLSDDEQTFIFKKHASDIGSTAITPLIIDNRLLGILAIANRDPNYYRSSMNTLFLNFIADVLSRIIVSYIPEK
ncbi:MAG: DUF484 family protein [Cellvibrionaceae bacterium]